MINGAADPDGPVQFEFKLEQYSTMSETAKDILTYHLPQALALFLRKNQGYGDMADVLGSRAQFVDMHRKMDKLKRALWDGADIGDEEMEEVVKDLFGHCLLMMRTLASERTD